MRLERDIKSLVLSYLLEKKIFKDQSLIINEFTYGSFSRRVDLALIQNNDFYGIEIKSEFDSLMRLEGQVSEYLKVFDKVIVVVASKHLEHAKNILPENVALWVISSAGIKVVRRGKKSKIKEKSTFINLMRVVDLIKLSKLFTTNLETRSRNELVKLVSKLPVSKLRETAFQALFRRYGDGSRLFFSIVKNRNVTNNDLEMLTQKVKSNDNRELSEIILDLNKNLNVLAQT